MDFYDSDNQEDQEADDQIQEKMVSWCWLYHYYVNVIMSLILLCGQEELKLMYLEFYQLQEQNTRVTLELEETRRLIAELKNKLRK